MRITATILLLTIHMFNIGGYRFLFDELESRASYQLMEQLDNKEYNDDDLLEMKVPLPMPYQTSWSSFERFDGEIEINGTHYNYVKRKVVNDTLILMCIPNQGKMKLNSAKEQFFSLVNDISRKGDQKSPSPKSSVIKSITTDYQVSETMVALIAPTAPGKVYFNSPQVFPGSLEPGALYQPPEPRRG
jgi:hypothetical protein